MVDMVVDINTMYIYYIIYNIYNIPIFNFIHIIYIYTFMYTGKRSTQR